LSGLRWIDVTPWILVAVLVHVAVLLAVYVWMPGVGPPPEEVTTVTIAVASNPFDAPPIPLVVPPTPDEPIEQPPLIEPELPEPILPEPDAVEEPSADLSAGGPAVESVSDSPGPVAPAGPGGAYANRGGPGKDVALQSYGGGSETESAVEAGLKWLAAHQSRDGAWDRRHFDEQCPELDVCRETAVSWPGTDAKPAVTGLALLAFLGAGHTHHSGDYREVVARGLHLLLSRQDATGCFGPPDRMQLYNDAIATLALAEAYALTHDPVLAPSVRSGVYHLVASQQSCGGWDYTSDMTTGRCDLSITGWVVMALKSASAVGVAIPDRTVCGIADMMAVHTDVDGQVFYANKGIGTVTDRLAGTLTRRYGPAMTAVGALVRQLLGWRRNSSILRAQTQLMLGELPDVARLRGGDPTGLHSEYYWYYGTLAVFNQGDPAWPVWNRAIRDALLRTQDRSISPIGLRRHSYGSWPAFGQGWGKWGRAGSKVYSTALGVLSLEVYYRYEPSFLAAHGLIRTSTLRAGLAERQGTERESWVAVATEQPVHVAEPVLVEVLQDRDARVRLRAAVGLARFGSPVGESVLRSMQPGAAGGERQAIDAALQRIAELSFPEVYGKLTRVDDEAGAVVFDTGGGAVYLEQVLLIKRDQALIARIRVTQRRPDHHLAAGAVVETTPGAEAPGVGDLVTR